MFHDLAVGLPPLWVPRCAASSSRLWLARMNADGEIRGETACDDKDRDDENHHAAAGLGLTVHFPSLQGLMSRFIWPPIKPRLVDNVPEQAADTGPRRAGIGFTKNDPRRAVCKESDQDF
jgi:hypothetical protein